MDKVILVPTWEESGAEWLEESGFSRVDSREGLPAVFRKGNVTLAVTGIGPDNSVRSLDTLRAEGVLTGVLPENILLTGTAGSYTIPVLDTVDCSPAGGQANLVCVHEFVSPDSPHPELHQPGVCFDMESEAMIAALGNGIRIIKLISDNGSGQISDWREHTVKVCRPHVHKIIEDFINA